MFLPLEDLIGALQHTRAAERSITYQLRIQPVESFELLGSPLHSYVSKTNKVSLQLKEML